MIRALVFDLDDTLVRTEPLKALSYARAAVELVPDQVTEARVLDAFREFVGMAREEVGRGLVEGLAIGAAIRPRMAALGVSEPWEALVKVRRRIYESMLADANLLLDNQVTDTVAVAREARQIAERTGLASMSQREDVLRVIGILGLEAAFDFVASRRDVERPKPDPEIYELVARKLDAPPGECLVIEDSPAGVEAARAAGMRWIAVPTELTREAFLSNQKFDRRWVVDDPKQLRERVMAAIQTV